MPRRRDHWSFRGAGSCWLLKLANERVYSGVIEKYSDTSVHLKAGAGAPDTRIPSHEIQWIRPLVTLQVDGWTILLGFHPDETDFETWWIKDDVVQRICYCDPLGFPVANDTPCGATAPDSPSAKTRAMAHALLHEALQRKRLETAVPGVRQQ